MRTTLEGQVIPLEWDREDRVSRIGVLLLDVDEEIELNGVDEDDWDDLIDAFVRVEGTIKSRTRGAALMRVHSIEFLDEDSLHSPDEGDVFPDESDEDE